MHGSDHAIGLCREEGEEPALLFDEVRVSFLVPLTPFQGRQMPANANSGRSSSSANHAGVLRGFVSAYSLNDETGTRQRNSGLSHGRQCGLFTLLTLVTGCSP
jgi:hypothetical protein